MIIQSEADIRNARLAFRNNSRGSVMSPAEIVLYPMACALVFVIGYSLVTGRLKVWPLAAAIPAALIGSMTGKEALSVYVFIGSMVAMKALVALGEAVLDEARRQMEEAK